MDNKLLSSTFFVGCAFAALCQLKWNKSLQTYDLPTISSTKVVIDKPSDLYKDTTAKSKSGMNDDGADCSDCSLANTAPHVDRHLIICGDAEDTNWPQIIENEKDTFAHGLSAALKEAAGSNAAPWQVKMTACNEPNTRAGHCDVLVYPEQLRLCVPLHDSACLSALARHLSLPELPAELPRGVVRSKRPLPGQTLLLVCTHGNRDKRCGRAGPILLAALEEELAARGVPSSQVAVRASSHIGGHRYAGALIVYPQGQWYGHMTKKTAAQLLDQVLGGGVLDKCFRGLGNVSW